MSPPARKELRRAHRLQEVGDHANAVAIFAHLAQEAFDRGFLNRALFLYLQAGYASALAGEADEAHSYARRGLRLLAESERRPLLRSEGQRLVRTLDGLGFQHQAQEIHQWLEETLETKIDVTARRRTLREMGSSLPSRCPHCEGTLYPEVVLRRPGQAAECPYCGSTIQIEG